MVPARQEHAGVKGVDHPHGQHGGCSGGMHQVSGGAGGENVSGSGRPSERFCESDEGP